MIPRVLGFLDDEVREGAMAEVGLGLLPIWWRGSIGGRATVWGGPTVAHLGLPFWLPPSSDKIEASVYFPRIFDLQKYCILTMLFPAES